MELIIILDIIFLIIVIVSVGWIVSIVSGCGGIVGSAFKLIGWGVVLMGFSHIIESTLLYFPEHHSISLIFFHHFVTVFSFLVIANGFRVLIKK